MLAELCTKKELWEASPTANLTYNTTDCEAHSGIEVRDLSYKEFWCKAMLAVCACRLPAQLGSVVAMLLTAERVTWRPSESSRRNSAGSAGFTR
jgi:hypothetical protein